MFRNGRPVDETISPNEYLYFRWFSDHVGSDGKLNQGNIHCPDQSVNRSANRGRCWYVLLPEPSDDPGRANRKLCMGVVRILASDVPSSCEHGGWEFSFRVEHDPIEHNYHHCEIRLYRNGDRLTKNEAGQLKKREKSALKVAKKFYRDWIYKLYRKKAIGFALKPEVGTNNPGA